MPINMNNMVRNIVALRGLHEKFVFLVSIYILGDLRKLQIYVIPEITFFHENETYSSFNHRTHVLYISL